jgi:hypothetical protein
MRARKKLNAYQAWAETRANPTSSGLLSAALAKEKATKVEPWRPSDCMVMRLERIAQLFQSRFGRGDQVLEVSDHRIKRQSHSNSDSFNLVLRLRRLDCLPLHIAWGIFAVAFERHHMIDDIAGATAGATACRGTGMLVPEGVLRSCTPFDASMRVALRDS